MDVMRIFITIISKSGVKNMKGYLQRRSLKPLKENCYKFAIAFSILTIVAYIVEIVVGKTETNHFTSVFFMSIASIIWIIFFTAIGIKTICKHRGKKVLGMVDSVLRTFNWLSTTDANTNRRYVIKYLNKKLKTPIYPRQIDSPKLFDKCVVYVWGPLKYTDFEEKVDE